MTLGLAHGLYALAWACFGALHSGLAGEPLKRTFGGAYRLAYNAIAVATAVAVYGLGRVLLGDAPPLDVPRGLPILAWFAHMVGWGLMFYGLTGYDLGRLLGTSQWRAARAGRRVPDDEPLRRDSLHRFVRHPLYSAGFLILWGGAAHDQMHLATAVWGSLYLIVGSRVEERRLLGLYGEDYARYRRAVPAFIPWKGAR